MGCWGWFPGVQWGVTAVGHLYACNGVVKACRCSFWEVYRAALGVALGVPVFVQCLTDLQGCSGGAKLVTVRNTHVWFDVVVQLLCLLGRGRKRIYAVIFLGGLMKKSPKSNCSGAAASLLTKMTFGWQNEVASNQLTALHLGQPIPQCV